MKIELKEITVRDLTNGYEDNQENGVVLEFTFGIVPTVELLSNRHELTKELRSIIVNTLNELTELQLKYKVLV